MSSAAADDPVVTAAPAADHPAAEATVVPQVVPPLGVTSVDSRLSNTDEDLLLEEEAPEDTEEAPVDTAVCLCPVVEVTSVANRPCLTEASLEETMAHPEETTAHPVGEPT